MDPRFPEKILPRLKELLKQFERVRTDIEEAELSSTLAGLEREGILVVQEITMVAPRLHDYLMQTSRNRRTAIARGLVKKPMENPYGEFREYAATAEKVEEPVEEPKPKNKTAKKKTTKKAKK